MSIDAKKWPALKAAWDEYGHAVPFEELVAVKAQRGCYAVVCWHNKDGSVGMADLARGSESAPWEMQNDGFDDITKAEWAKLKIVADCDWFVIPGNDKFQGC